MLELMSCWKKNEAGISHNAAKKENNQRTKGQEFLRDWAAMSLDLIEQAMGKIILGRDS
ncbi:MAG: hypothetical protein HPY58_04220 [Firmicutes bacterium]|nr:hypothetical protein [Bacillota bacterium]